MRGRGVCKITTEFEWERIYEALKERGVPATAQNVKVLVRYLASTARDCSSDALIDFANSDIDTWSTLEALEQQEQAGTPHSRERKERS